MSYDVNNIDYQYGDGGLALNTSDQYRQLEDKIIQAEASDLTQSGQGAPIYQYLLSILSDTSGNHLPGINANVFAWIKGAQGVNDASSIPGQLIRDYTSAVYQIRYGRPLSEAELNAASNNIALNLARGILSHEGRLPSIEGLGTVDAGSIASHVFHQTPDPELGVYSPWAGTLLFPYLFEPEFYVTWLLNMNTVQGTVPDASGGAPNPVYFKSIGGSYDLVASLDAFQNAALTVLQNLDISSPTSLMQDVWSQFGATVSISSLGYLIGDTQNFLSTAYGVPGDQFPNFGSGAPFSLDPITGAPSYVAGSLGDDEISLDSVTDMVVNAGPGDDLILGAIGGGIIDGGDGVDTIDYSAVPPDRGALTFTLEASNSSSFTSRFEVTASGDPASEFLYSIENINGNDAGDTLRIPVLDAAFWSAGGRIGTVDLGAAVVEGSSNQVVLDGTTSEAYDYFSVSSGAIAGQLVVSAAASNTAAAGDVVVVDPGTLIIQAGNSGGTLKLSGDLSATLGSTAAIRFIGGTGTDLIDNSALTRAQQIDVRMATDERLEIADPQTFAGTISNFAPGNTIDLKGVGTATSATLDVNNILTVVGADGGPIKLTLDPSHDYSREVANVVSDGEGGTSVTITELPTYKISFSLSETVYYLTTSTSLGLPDPVTLSVTGEEIFQADRMASIYYMKAGSINVNTSDGGINNLTEPLFYARDNFDQSTVVGNYIIKSPQYPTERMGYHTLDFMLNYPSSIFMQLAAFGGDNRSPGDYSLNNNFGINLLIPISDGNPVAGSYQIANAAYPDSVGWMMGGPTTQFSHYLHITTDSDGNITSENFPVYLYGAANIEQISPCFCRGSRLLTGHGYREVENIRIGDIIALKSGGTEVVSWVGHRWVDCRRHSRPHDVWPVRIRAGAFACDIPQRDLLLSPDHAVFIDGVLIPVRYLINGATIVQEPVDEVMYYHVELDRHAVILAEGLSCESYLDTGNRSAFANGGPTVQMHPDFALREWEMRACAPLVRSGVELEAARSYLLWQAQELGHHLTTNPDLRVVVNGQVLFADVCGRRHRFYLPNHTATVRVVSCTAVPAHTHDDSSDYRVLGVAISGICLDGRPVDLGGALLTAGWHQVEPAWRWTNGDAVLDVSGARVLELTIAMTERYWLSDLEDAPQRSAVA